jgi:hypothetical protein
MNIHYTTSSFLDDYKVPMLLNNLTELVKVSYLF